VPSFGQFLRKKKYVDDKNRYPEGVGVAAWHYSPMDPDEYNIAPYRQIVKKEANKDVFVVWVESGERNSNWSYVLTQSKTID